MDFVIENASLKSVAGNNIPERFFAPDVSCRFSLVEGKEQFSWSGIPGERYAVDAPLNATAWGEEYRKDFGHWRCAVFAPSAVENGTSPRKIPIVFLFGGIGDDYFNTEIYLWRLMQGENCIVVAFDTPLTGERNLVAPGNYTENAFVQSLRKMEKDGCAMRNAAFREMIEEMAFNVLQVRAFLNMRFGVDKDAPLFTMGFSLGGFYATQIALCLKDCKMCVAGAAAPDINLYSGPLFGTMRMLPEWFTALFGQIDQIAVARAVRPVTETPFDIAHPASPDLQVHYVIGEQDLIVSADSVKAHCFGRVSADRVHVIPIANVDHTPCGEDGLNDLGNRMVNTLLEGIRAQC